MELGFWSPSGTPEDPDAPQIPTRSPSPSRRSRAGTRVKQLAKTFQVSEATIYNWLKQDKIDRGELEGLSTDQAINHACRVLARLAVGLLRLEDPAALAACPQTDLAGR